MVSIPCAPLMHGTGLWIGWFIPHLRRRPRRHADRTAASTPTRCCHARAGSGASITIVGDSFAKPLIRAIDEGKPDGSKYDTSSIGDVRVVGRDVDTEVKQQMLDRIEQVVLLDAMGSSEGRWAPRSR